MVEKGMIDAFTDDTIRVAVKEWLKNPDEAKGKYGEMGSWDVSEVKDMSGLFENQQFFNEDIRGWDVGAVTNMERMFKGCEAFNQDISGWKVEGVE
ncbi:hypothetical protein TrRE_jg12623, partial [Triparma retinervis]